MSLINKKDSYKEYSTIMCINCLNMGIKMKYIMCHDICNRCILSCYLPRLIVSEKHLSTLEEFIKCPLCELDNDVNNNNITNNNNLYNSSILDINYFENFIDKYIKTNTKHIINSHKQSNKSIDYKVSSFLQNEIIYFNENIKNNNNKCEGCSTNQIELYCNFCEIYLCNKCLINKHHKIKIFKNHNLSCNVDNYLNKNLCRCLKERKIEFLCNSCDDYFCINCILLDHLDHNFNSNYLPYVLNNQIDDIEFSNLKTKISNKDIKTISSNNLIGNVSVNNSTNLNNSCATINNNSFIKNKKRKNIIIKEKYMNYLNRIINNSIFKKSEFSNELDIKLSSSDFNLPSNILKDMKSFVFDIIQSIEKGNIITMPNNELLTIFDEDFIRQLSKGVDCFINFLYNKIEELNNQFNKLDSNYMLILNITKNIIKAVDGKSHIKIENRVFPYELKSFIITKLKEFKIKTYKQINNKYNVLKTEFFPSYIFNNNINIKKEIEQIPATEFKSSNRKELVFIFKGQKLRNFQGFKIISSSKMCNNTYPNMFVVFKNQKGKSFIAWIDFYYNNIEVMDISNLNLEKMNNDLNDYKNKSINKFSILNNTNIKDLQNYNNYSSIKSTNNSEDFKINEAKNNTRMLRYNTIKQYRNSYSYTDNSYISNINNLSNNNIENKNLSLNYSFIKNFKIKNKKNLTNKSLKKSLVSHKSLICKDKDDIICGNYDNSNTFNKNNKFMIKENISSVANKKQKLNINNIIIKAHSDTIYCLRHFVIDREHYLLTCSKDNYVKLFECTYFTECFSLNNYTNCRSGVVLKYKNSRYIIVNSFTKDYPINAYDYQGVLCRQFMVNGYSYYLDYFENINRVFLFNSAYPYFFNVYDFESCDIIYSYKTTSYVNSIIVTPFSIPIITILEKTGRMSQIKLDNGDIIRENQGVGYYDMCKWNERYYIACGKGLGFDVIDINTFRTVDWYDCLHKDSILNIKKYRHPELGDVLLTYGQDQVIKIYKQN